MDSVNILRYFNLVLAAKIAYFCQAAKDGAYLFNLILYLTSIGLEKSEAGLIGGLRLLGLLIGAPMWGLLADRKGSHRLILIAQIIISILLMCSQIPFSILFAEHEFNRCNIGISANDTIIFSTNKSYLAQNDSREMHTKLFTATLLLNMLSAFFDTCILGILDTVTLIQIVNREKGDYGKVTTSRYTGFIFGVFMSNVSIENFPASHITCYAVIFFIYLIFMSGLLISTLFLTKDLLPTSNAPTRKRSKIRIILKMFQETPSMHLFFFVVIVVGMEEALYSGYTFVYMKEIKSSAIEMSLCVAIGQISCVLFSLASERINIHFRNPWYSFSVACTTNAVIYVITPFLGDPLFVLTLQLLRGASFALFIPTAVRYLQENSTKDILATMISIMNSMFFGVGSILAHVMGGYVYHIYDIKVLFISAAFIAVFCLVTIIVYISISTSYCKRTNPSALDESEKKIFQHVDEG